MGRDGARRRNAEPLALCNSVARAFVSAAGPARGSTGQPRLTGRGARFGGRRHLVPRRRRTRLGLCRRRPGGRPAAGRDARHAHHRRRKAQGRLRRRHPPAYGAARGASRAGTHRSHRRGRRQDQAIAGARRRGAARAAGRMVHGRSAERVGTGARRGQSRSAGNAHEAGCRGCRSTAPKPWTPSRLGAAGVAGHGHVARRGTARCPRHRDRARPRGRAGVPAVGGRAARAIWLASSPRSCADTDSVAAIAEPP